MSQNATKAESAHHTNDAPNCMYAAPYFQSDGRKKEEKGAGKFVFAKTPCCKERKKTKDISSPIKN